MSEDTVMNSIAFVDEYMQCYFPLILPHSWSKIWCLLCFYESSVFCLTFGLFVFMILCLCSPIEVNYFWSFDIDRRDWKILRRINVSIHWMRRIKRCKMLSWDGNLQNMKLWFWRKLYLLPIQKWGLTKCCKRKMKSFSWSYNDHKLKWMWASAKWFNIWLMSRKLFQQIIFQRRFHRRKVLRKWSVTIQTPIMGKIIHLMKNLTKVMVAQIQGLFYFDFFCIRDWK